MEMIYTDNLGNEYFVNYYNGIFYINPRGQSFGGFMAEKIPTGWTQL